MRARPGTWLAMAALCLALGQSAAAQTEPGPASDASSVVTELAPVQVNLPGPAMWKVSRGGSEVIILGFVRPLPHSLDWPKTRLTRALTGASVLLIPPEPRLGVLDAMGLVFTMNRLQNPGGRTLRQVLSPEDYQAFLGAVASAHTAPKAYERLKPLIAGVALISDYRKAAGYSSEKPVSTVEKLARHVHIPVRSVGQLKASSLIHIATTLDEPRSIACFRQELAQIAWEAREATPAAQAWGRGDIAALRGFAAKSVIAECLEDLPSIQALTERGTADAVAAMDQALSRPGKSVALVEMRYLDRANGLLDRLRAKGATVSVPD